MKMWGLRNKVELYIATGVLLLAIVGSIYDCQAQGPRLGYVRIIVAASPRRVVADGQTRARIRVELRDPQGGHLPDGTVVIISIEPPALLSEAGTDKRGTLTVRSSGGFATVFATSDTPGTAKITARVQTSSNVAYVEFVPKGELVGREARVIEIRGGWVGYSMELNMVEARDQAVARYGGMTVTGGDILQLDLGRMVLKAEPVLIKRGDQQLAGEDLYFDLRTKRGALRRFAQGVERVFFDIYSLTPRESDWELPTDAFRPNRAESDAWLVADSISVFVNEKIVLRHAKMYVGDQKVLSLPPLWIIGMPGYRGAASTQVLGLSSGDGLAVNFPLFYRVTDQATGAMEIQRGARAGSVIARRGWSLGLREEYASGDVEGAVVVGGLPRSDWGMEWRDSRPVFGNALGDFSVAWPDHHNLFADANVYQYRDSYRLNLRGYYDAMRTAPDGYGLTADWLTSARPLSRDKRDTFRLGTSLALRHSADQEGGLTLRNELYTAVDPHSWRLGRGTWLTPNVSDVYSWDTADFSANSARGSLRLQHDFGNSVDLDIDYSAEHASGDAYQVGWRQALSTSLWADGSKWRAYLNGFWDLTEDGAYGDLAFDHYLTDRWRLGLLGTYYRFGDAKFDDIELVVGWSVWQNREIGLRYSQDTGKFSVELGGLASSF